MESSLYPLDTVKVVFELDKVLLSEFIRTAKDRYKSLQQDLSICLLLQDQQQILSMSKTQLRQAVLVVPNDYSRLNSWAFY